MKRNIKVAVVGLGKMGISHFALVNAHPVTETIACDATGFMVDVLRKNISNRIYKKYDDLLENEKLDAVVIATPSRHHGSMVRSALSKGIHVFCEKPFCLDWQESFELAEMAEAKGLINQVGYHYRFVGAFRRMKEIVDSGALGTITHVLAEAYGPVVLQPKRQTWRTQKAEGGGCLYDYAAHPVNLLNWMFGLPEHVSGSHLNSIFSTGIDDEVFSTLRFESGATAQLSVNWSDASQRKMTTKITMIGTNGRLFADRQECQLFLREAVPALPDQPKGWSVQYTTDLTEEPWFYLRGEEYSHQIGSFLEAVAEGRGAAAENSFASAAVTDKSIAMILNDSSGMTQAPVSSRPAAPRKGGWFRRS
jgi:predicted dehydrogenase